MKIYFYGGNYFRICSFGGGNYHQPYSFYPLRIIMKLKSIQTFFYIIIALLVLPLTTYGAAGVLPQVNCAGLPGCVDNNLDEVTTRL